jgi:hypothetical protein
MTRVTLRPTIPADLPFCIGEPLPHRIRAITALIGDRVIAVGGIGYRPDGTVLAFGQFNDEFRKYPVAIHRAGVMGMALIRETGVPMVVAEAQPGNPAAAPWLLRFGFKPIAIAGRTVYVWRRQE